jgi:hypothetical protein
MRHPAFLAGEYDTGFIDRHKAELAPAEPDDAAAALAAAAAALHARAADGGGADAGSDLDLSRTELSSWRRG